MCWIFSETSRYISDAPLKAPPVKLAAKWTQRRLKAPPVKLAGDPEKAEGTTLEIAAKWTLRRLRHQDSR